MSLVLEADVIIVLPEGRELARIELPNDVDLCFGIRETLPTKQETVDSAAAEIAMVRRIAQRQDRPAETTRSTSGLRRNKRRLRARLAVFVDRRHRRGTIHGKGRQIRGENACGRRRRWN